MKSQDSQQHQEGPIAKTIEQQTAKLPSDTFLWLALGSIATSATMHLLGKRETSNFIGQWAPTFLIFGLYNKLVKLEGSDRSYSQSGQYGSQSSGGSTSSRMGNA